MLWQEEVCSIVCLTNLTEGTKVGVHLRDIEYADIYSIKKNFNKVSYRNKKVWVYLNDNKYSVIYIVNTLYYAIKKLQ